MTREEALKQIREWDFLNDEERAALETLIPELRESEDERFRKYILQVCKECVEADDSGLELSMSTTKKLLAYLEKQKEQKETLLMSDADLYFDEWNQQNQNPTKRQCFEEGIKYAQRLQKEQKSIKGGDIITNDNVPYHRVFMVLGTVDERNYKEEHSRYCESLLLGVDGNVCCDNTDLKGYRIVTTNERAQFLHDFKCSTKVDQKPSEWSEEDEKDMAHIIRILDDCYAYGKHDLSKTDHENLVNKLKSLRPQLSDEDIKKIRSEEYTKGFNDAAFGGKAWKPSKVFIDALEEVVEILPECPSKGAIEYVLPDLKKLM